MLLIAEVAGEGVEIDGLTSGWTILTDPPWRTAKNLDKNYDMGAT